MTWVPGEALAIKLLDIVQASGAGLVAPWQHKRMERARNKVSVERELLLSHCEKLKNDLVLGRLDVGINSRLVKTPSGADVDYASSDRIGRNSSEATKETADHQSNDSNPVSNQAASEPHDQSQFVLDAVNRQAAIDNLQRHCNLLRILNIAVEEAHETPDEAVSQESVDADWFTRWRNSAEHITNENLQILWARVLSGEAKAPGSFSLSTLDVLRNLSSSEAKLIEKCLSVSFNNFIPRMPNGNLFLDALNFDEILHLSELNIVRGAESIGALSQKLKTITNDRFECYLVCHNKILILKAADQDRKFKVSCLYLTRIGREISKLGHFRANIDFLMAFGKNLKSESFDVLLADFIPGRTPSEPGRFLNALPI